jgi:EAL domain-containing protein (putative c-di-GMP-specific phosphodiesterase class I)/GGDEF domain-containing protein
MSLSGDPVAGLVRPSHLRSALLGCEGPHALILLDLDDLHAYNLATGWEAGDALLRDVAEVLTAQVPDGRVLRLPSDEFAVVLPCSGPDDALELAHELAAALAGMTLTGRTWTPSACFGAVMLVHHVNAADETRETREVDVRRTVQCAGMALQEARRVGPGSVAGLSTDASMQSSPGSFERPGSVGASGYADVDVRTALRLEDFEPYFQPLVDPATSRPLGLEALVRRATDSGEALGPDDFMHLVREAQLSVEFGTFVIDRALACWAEGLGAAVRAASGADVASSLLTVNIDIEQAQQEGFDALVLHLLDRAGVPAGELLVEVAEPVLADASAVRRLQALRAAGVRVALDDFGAGPLMLGDMSDLPVDVIKVDQMLVGRLDPLDPDMGLIRDLQRLTDLLGLLLSVEAVETPILATRLVALGVPLAQGFHYARPMPAELAMAWLLEQVVPGAATPGAGGA